ncbi:MAG: YkvA family protein [Salinivenus sp.]
MSDTPNSAPEPHTADGLSVWGRVRSGLHRLRNRALPDRLDRIDREYVADGARRVTEADLDTVVERADAIEQRFRGDGPLGRLMEDGRLLLHLVRDARHGRYREVPVWTLSAAAFALLYVLNPLDLIPDALPVLGLVDDAAVVSACLALVEQDLYAYRAWRRTGSPAEQPDSGDSQTGGKKTTSG